MRSMPSTLITAIGSTDQELAISVQVIDQTPSFSQLTNNLNAPAGHVAGDSTTAGSIICALIQTNGIILTSRITNPSDPAQWQASPATATTDAIYSAGCALANDSTRVRLFYVRAADLAVCYVDSTNDGFSWGAEQLVSLAPSGKTYAHGIAAPNTTQVFVAYSTTNTPLAAPSIIYSSAYALPSGPWSALATKGPTDTTFGQVRGLAAVAPTNPIILAGFMRTAQVSGFSAGAYTVTNGTPGSWNTIHTMDPPGTGLGFQYPSVTFDGQHYYATVTLMDDGTVSGVAQSRTAIWQSPDAIAWNPVANLGNLFPAGAAIVVKGGVSYVFDGQTVMQSTTGQTSLDLTHDLVTLEIIEKPNAETAATLTLSNYNLNYLHSAQLKPNAAVSVKLGYGPDLIGTHVLYIDQVRYEAVADRLDVIIDLRDCCKFLTQVCNRFIALSGKTITQLIQYVCAQAGVTVGSIGTTPQFSQVIPCFVITPGETWDTALNRLANVYAFSYRTEGSTVIFSERQAADSSVWSYSTETLGINWSRSADQSSVIRVIGAPTGNTVAFAEAIDTAQLTATGRERYRHIVERLLTTSAQCQIKAGLAMHEEQTRATTGSLSVALNPGLELLDVLSLTDARVGLTNQVARIEELHWHIDMNNGAYYQQLALVLP